MKLILAFLFIFSVSQSVYGVGSILLVGESHVDDSRRDNFASELKDYAKLGYRYLALEMFKDNRQNILDLFNSSPEDHEQKVLELLDKEWGYNSYSYLDLMNEASRQGMKVIALDLPKNELPKEIGLFPVLPELSVQMDARNQRMAQNLSSILQKDPATRILVLVGSFHVKPYAIPKYLARLGHFYKVKAETDF